MLRDLAADCGMAYPDTARLTDADLVSVWRVSLKSPDAGPRMVEKISKRLGLGTAPSTPHAAPTAPASGISPADLMRAVREATAPLEAALGDMRAEVADVAREAAEAALKALTPMRLDVSVNAAPVVSLGLSHFQTPRVIRYLARKQHVYLYGPAGSGKTTMGRKCAEAFGLQFYMAAKVADEFLLLGFRDARGEVVRTPFRDAFEHGGVFLFDELDRSGASAVTAINAALANGFCAFPDGLVYAHPDFKCIAAGNTTMRGADPLYNAGEQQDASVLDRFSFIHFPYDDALENSLSTDADWLAYVRAVRAAVAAQGLDVIVSPRATLNGQAAIADGETWEDVAESEIFKGLDPSNAAMLQSAARHAWKG
jgi:hypothetical protein